jgi:hypothetical protein
MTEPLPADGFVHLDAELLKRLVALTGDVGEKFYAVVRRKLAHNQDAPAVTLFAFAASAMLGRMLLAFPEIDSITGQINAFWRVIGLPFRIEITRVQ